MDSALGLSLSYEKNVSDQTLRNQTNDFEQSYLRLWLLWFLWAEGCIFWSLKGAESLQPSSQRTHLAFLKSPFKSLGTQYLTCRAWIQCVGNPDRMFPFFQFGYDWNLKPSIVQIFFWPFCMSNLCERFERFLVKLNVSCRDKNCLGEAYAITLFSHQSPHPRSKQFVFPFICCGTSMRAEIMLNWTWYSPKHFSKNIEMFVYSIVLFLLDAVPIVPPNFSPRNSCRLPVVANQQWPLQPGHKLFLFLSFHKVSRKFLCPILRCWYTTGRFSYLHDYFYHKWTCFKFPHLCLAPAAVLKPLPYFQLSHENKTSDRFHEILAVQHLQVVQTGLDNFWMEFWSELVRKKRNPRVANQSKRKS